MANYQVATIRVHNPETGETHEMEFEFLGSAVMMQTGTSAKRDNKRVSAHYFAITGIADGSIDGQYNVWSPEALRLIQETEL